MTDVLWNCALYVFHQVHLNENVYWNYFEALVMCESVGGGEMKGQLLSMYRKFPFFSPPE